MTWLQLREHYARLFLEAQRREGATQQSVARKGGLKGQNAISKLLINDKRGPCVDTLLRAIEGLGLDVATFFTTLGQTSATPPTAPPIEERRANDGTQPSSQTVSSLVISTRIEQIPAQPLDVQQFDAIIQQHFAALARKLGYHQRGQPLGGNQCGDARANPPATPRRKRHRRRARNIA